MRLDAQDLLATLPGRGRREVDLPGRSARRAAAAPGSIASTRLVVPMTITPSARRSPSRSASSWVTERASDWLAAIRRTGAIASSSSMKMIDVGG